PRDSFSRLQLHPLPPTPTLFPYTTLFRSHGEQSEENAGSDRSGDVGDPGGAQSARGSSGCIRATNGSCRTGRSHCHPLGPVRTLDRKSTRLNSSHLGISYAVFCLKKKTHR